ncbi:MAG: hypothetical protein SPD85_00940 [Candidatus Cryptobacteroides sp.]|nr:hypothetical protein [Candidatus Cryptobacteroides sp.]
MKKYIFIALAAAGTMACSKLTPVDSIPVTELPEDETTETVAPKEGETITIQLAQTKVTLNKTVYVFEGNEQIVVKAASGPVATISNSTEDPNIFTGVFERPLDTENPSFDFYYNCTDASGNPNYEQNGQPWLEHKGVTATRATDGGYAYYVVEEVQLRQPEGYVALAITSDEYDCTVSFNTLQKDPQTVGKTIEGIAVSRGKPYFVNVSKEDLTEGFYLAVNKKGETGTMYTSYGTTAPISSNQIIKIKKEFEAFSGVKNLKITGFETTYSYYTDDNSETNPNTKNYSWMNEGTVKFNLKGISSSLVNLTFNNGDKDVTVKEPLKSEDLFTYTFDSTEDHTTFGEKTLKATVSFKAGIEPGATKETTAVRHITGLPYTLTPDKDHWSAKKVSLYISFNNTYIEIKGNPGNPHPLIESSPHFHIPKSIDVNAKFNYSLTSGKYYISVLKMYIGGINRMSHTGAKKTTEEITDKNVTGTLNASCPYIEFEGITDGASSMEGVYSRVYTVELKYK